MWCYIKNEDVGKYCMEHNQIGESFNEIALFKNDEITFLPRLLHKNYPSQYLKMFYGKMQFVPKNIEMKFKGELRDNQKPVLKTVMSLYQKNSYINGIIKSFPGSGKTIMSVDLISRLKFKPIIIVNNSNLMGQWAKAIIDFTNLDENSIGLIHGGNKVFDRPITIAMTQSLLSLIKKDVKEALNLIDNSGYGLVIYDEVHSTSAASAFSKVSLLFRTQNIIGLSATPFQTGVHEILMKNTVGEIIYETKNYNLKPIYQLTYYNSELDKKKIYLINNVNDYIQRKSIYNKFITDSSKYFNIIVNSVQRLLKDKHKVMIVCFTKKQVILISDKLKEIGIENTKFYGEQKELNYNEDVIVCTYAFAGQGFDYKELSALVLACPLAGKKSLIQVVGRILRASLDKQQPVVVDLIDMCFPTNAGREVAMKENIIRNEFDCEIKFIHEKEII